MAPIVPSGNWAKLKQSLPAPDSSRTKKKKARRNFLGLSAAKSLATGSSAEFAREAPTVKGKEKATAHVHDEVVLLPPPSDSPLLQELRQMVAGTLDETLNATKRAPGNYIAIDCEMVGLGHLGAESALARVSLVNYHGHVLLDTFVQPRERVTDYRTWVSGVRETDLAGAPTFDEVQKQVAKLVEGRIIVGHAIENDMKALLLSHPAPFVRDTQKNKELREAAKNKRPGLKKLSEIELGLKIQEGKHSSITDARATMALYRLHKTAWEASMRSAMEAYKKSTARTGEHLAAERRKRKRFEGKAGGEDSEAETEDGEIKEDAPRSFPGGGRKGISSGLSVVVRRFGKKVESDQPKRRGPAAAPRAGGGNWWEEAPS